MADKFKLNIISPEKKFLEGDCEFLEFVSTEGELGIYAKHIPLTTILEPVSYTHLTLPTNREV